MKKQESALMSSCHLVASSSSVKSAPVHLLGKRRWPPLRKSEGRLKDIRVASERELTEEAGAQLYLSCSRE